MGPKSCSPVGIGYVRPDQFQDHLTVITTHLSHNAIVHIVMIKVMITILRMLMIMLIGMSTVKMIVMKAIYIQSVTDDGRDYDDVDDGENYDYLTMMIAKMAMYIFIFMTEID